MNIEIKDIVSLLAIWGALLSTYLFIQNQSDRRRKLKSERLIKITIKYSATPIDVYPYSAKFPAGASMIDRDNFFPFHFTVTNESEIPVQIIDANTIIWEADTQGDPQDFWGSVKMGAVSINCFSELPSRNYLLKGRESISLVPINEIAFNQARHYMSELNSNLLLLPQLITSTDGLFQGSLVAPMTVLTKSHKPPFQPITSRYRD